MVTIPDITYNLLLNEIFKYSVSSDPSASLLESLRTFSKEDLLEKKSQIKEMGLSVGERVISFIVKEHV